MTRCDKCKANLQDPIRQDYLEHCVDAGCEFYGENAGTHYNCGSRWRLRCPHCQTIFFDSADDVTVIERLTIYMEHPWLASLDSEFTGVESPNDVPVVLERLRKQARDAFADECDARWQTRNGLTNPC